MKEPIPYSPPPQPRRMSQKAAEAAEHVNNLENHIGELEASVRSLRGMLEVSEQKLGSAQSELLLLRDERDYYQKRCIEISTKLAVAGQIILDVMREGPVPEYRRVEPKSEAQLSAEAKIDEAVARLQPHLTEQ